MKKRDYAVKRVILTWPQDLHKIVKLHATMREESINNWVLRCIIEQLEREKTHTVFKLD